MECMKHSKMRSNLSDLAAGVGHFTEMYVAFLKCATNRRSVVLGCCVDLAAKSHKVDLERTESKAQTAPLSLRSTGRGNGTESLTVVLTVLPPQSVLFTRTRHCLRRIMQKVKGHKPHSGFSASVTVINGGYSI